MSESAEMSSDVVTLHGVNVGPGDTWQHRLDETLQKSGFTHHLYRDFEYGDKDFGQLLRLGFVNMATTRLETAPGGSFVKRGFGFEGFLNKRVDAFAEYYGKHLVGKDANLIAHSFGTLIVSEALSKFDTIAFDCVIFIGAVVSLDYDWGKLISNGQVRLVKNEMGKEDSLVRAIKAGRRVVDFARVPIGPSGIPPGFTIPDLPQLTQTNFEKFDHSDYHLVREHANKHWFPFFSDNTLAAVIETGNNEAFELAFGPLVRATITEFFRRLFREKIRTDELQDIYQVARDGIMKAGASSTLPHRAFITQRVRNLLEMIRKETKKRL